ncbi:methionine-R-sulfoxide reductase [Chthonomonas calidirosea]|uniref:Peptide methionine sulfoxide reductase MsrB n=1 Tax=Chthonomonas calidirosea (strain DSM 23976 / ICMP 18418 / T49) TaxID=1303518 RepID=S0EUL6_CHTCT|nr:peptide-methionine (R)-S-oxide reductase MsrB [Chthonomonas calidirosea]CCW34037.1 methionine-R-sulfoxide reductase [Chthonomonas calidirosea T49]CEK14810.1 methionine-R-sulfoxide reductase [Chthonomonas calidirosea]CEK14811.1 methionine-R-sulfoxide reductase [Chthonomonas calidirosea]CEK15937.1 methionine-R-sulfoxide reductase [Chthonomonas calidirosea]
MGQEKIVRSEEEWRKILTPEQYYVLRQAGTEPAFTGKYYKNHETGVYACAGCGEVLFTSDTKYESGSGWPSFWDAVDEQKLELLDDYSHGMHRIEVRCAKCGGHLGHLFDDGPRPTGKRYCINSASLQFHKREEQG